MASLHNVQTLKKLFYVPKVQGKMINLNLCLFLVLSFLSVIFSFFMGASIYIAEKDYKKAQNISGKSEFLAYYFDSNLINNLTFHILY